MIKLDAKLSDQWDADPFIVRVQSSGADGLPAGNEALLVDCGQNKSEGFRAYLLRAGCEGSTSGNTQAGGSTIVLPPALEYVSDGDIVRVSPRAGEIWVMYRRNSPHNAIFITEQCNSNCVMCSQPPKQIDDRYLSQGWLEAIPLMSPETPELSITGGEPTLLTPELLRIIAACKEHLPTTALHMLSNGRLFSYLSLCRDLAQIGHPDLMIGIPLYSDLAWHHDFVVQAAGAFDQTVRGIMNLERCGVRVELRVVLHSQTISRLPQLARFIARNLPFVQHVALMGLELMGYVRMNLDALWSDPVDYQEELCEAVAVLDRGGLNVSIYNHQLCVLDQGLWPYARRSISDWKNEYLEECEACAVREQCGGFFASARIRRSDYIRAVSHDQVNEPVASCPLSITHP